jgi:TPP-dependent pyruvate/acetoin dehydrogenase alpha subunit
MQNTISSLYETMLLIREVEEHIRDVYHTDVIKSPVHLSIGQEYIAAAVCNNLLRDDFVSNTYRGHATYIAKGGNLNEFMAELYGKDSGCAGGKAGSMHTIDIKNGILGSSAVVGTTIPIAAGYSWALKQKNKNGSQDVVAAFFGDGSTEEGVFYETLNYAALQKLPILFICENNGLAIHSKLSQRWANHNICEKVISIGIEAYKVDGPDVLELNELIKLVLAKVRSGLGPVFIECKTYRWLEHVGIADDHHEYYRDVIEYEKWKKLDPIAVLEKKLDANKVAVIKANIKNKIKESIAFAKNSSFPDTFEKLMDKVYAD